MKKRLLSLMLALIMVFALLPMSALAATTSADGLINYARQYLGVPYVSGGRSSSGFDCCGFVWYVCNHFGIDVGTGNQTSQIKYGTAISYDKSNYSNVIKNMQKGDLVFFDYYDNGVSDHVAIYTGNGNVINAENGGVKEHTLNQGGWEGRYMWQSICGVRRVIKSSTSYMDKCTGYYSYCTLKTTDKTTLKSLPCAASTTSQSKSIATLAAGTTLTATKIYKNSEGNYWYKVSYDGNTCYVYSGNTKVSSFKTSDITISNVKKPSTINKGSTFSIEGTVKTTHNKLAWVTGYIFPNNVEHKAANALYSGGSAASNNSYSLKGSTADNKLLFNKLSKGTYAYMVEAMATSYYCTDGKTMKTHNSYIVVIDSQFTVK